MNIVRGHELITLPTGTLFQACDDLNFGSLCRLDQVTDDRNDFWYTPLSQPQWEEAQHLIHFPCSRERHGLYDLNEARFLVWEAADVALLRRQLHGETFDGLDDPEVLTIHARFPLP